MVGRDQARIRHVRDAGGGGQREAIGRIILFDHQGGVFDDPNRAGRIESHGAEVERIACLIA